MLDAILDELHPWFQFALIPMAMAQLVIVGVWISRIPKWLKYRRLERGICPKCKYPLSLGRCPECGWAISQAL